MDPRVETLGSEPLDAIDIELLYKCIKEFLYGYCASLGLNYHHYRQLVGVSPFQMGRPGSALWESAVVIFSGRIGSSAYCAL